MAKHIRYLLLFPVVTSLVFGQASPDTQNLPLMPWPATLSRETGSVPIDSSFSVALSGAGSKDSRLAVAIDRLFARLSLQTGIPLQPRVFPSGSTAKLTIVVEQRDHRPPQRLGDDESYSLAVTNGQIRIASDKPLGAMRGIDTFLQLVGQNIIVNGAGNVGFSVPAVTIRDDPRFPWRGLSLDVSRHFIPVDGIKRTIDGLSAVKLNVLHWHLSDDQGFRVESRKYPRLQQYGSDNMFYTQARIRDIIGYARDRGVRIVPEFDMPGHAASWLPGYPKLGVEPGTAYEIVRGAGIFGHLLDPTKESTYKFLNGFVGEMAKLFPDEYFHIGGDEVNPKEWNDDPHVRAFMRKHKLADGNALQTYFNQRLLKIVTRHGKHMEGWDEILQPDLPKSIVVQSWRGQPSLWQGAREGFQGILSAGYYLDLMYPASYHYSIDPMKVPPPAPGHKEEAESPADGEKLKPGTPADLTAEQAKLILGGEAAMWEELATAENLDAKLWPRLAAIAERFWSPESITNPQSMYRRLYTTNHWLEWLGLTQRSNLELMRQRLAGSMPYQLLDTFSSILEPVKGYSRHAEKYSILSPFNRLVDAIPPESNTAREFRDGTDKYLAAAKGQRNSQPLRDQLSLWAESSVEARPMLQQSSLLAENSALADDVEALCRAGLEAFVFLDGTARAPAGWKDDAEKLAGQYDNKRTGDLLIQIAPAIHKLVEAVPGSQAGSQ
ncbi:MAG: beta-N-acetylhexosaminidase [Acidobacteriota bacterium]|nr:beta-N-acetylhexosaminidase [Acidobacteriota bacterium]